MAESDLRAGPNANDLHAHVRFIQAVSALKLDRTSAVDLLNQYVRDYRTHTRAPLAMAYLGDYYFSRRIMGMPLRLMKKPMVLTHCPIPSSMKRAIGWLTVTTRPEMWTKH